MTESKESSATRLTHVCNHLMLAAAEERARRRSCRSSVPAPGVGLRQPARLLWDHAERHPGRVAHDPPLVDPLDALRAGSFQPGDLCVQVIGVDVEVHPRLTPVQTLDEQADVVATEPTAVVLRILGVVDELLASHRLPEREFCMVRLRRDVDDDL